MWELAYKESRVLKNWCFWTVVLEETLKCPLDCKEIQPVHPKGNHSWIFIGRTDADAETPILWPSDLENNSFEKTLMLGKIEGRRRRGWQRMRWLDGFTGSIYMNLSILRELVMDREAWHAVVHGIAKSWMRLTHWTELNQWTCVSLFAMASSKLKAKLMICTTFLNRPCEITLPLFFNCLHFYLHMDFAFSYCLYVAF